MIPKRAIVWFRQDLRIHDNEALHDALKMADEVIPVFIFDERVFLGDTRFGFRKTNKFRARFIIESVQDLRESFKKLGLDLIVRVGRPEEEIWTLANTIKSSWVFCNRERTQEEVDVQDSLEQKLWTIGQEVFYSRGKMLYYTQDLPFPVTHTPDVFTHFRKEVEKTVAVRAPLPLSSAPLPRCSVSIAAGAIPTLQDFGWAEFEPDPRGVLYFKGGETVGLNHLKQYFEQQELAAHYKETRNGLIGADYSTKFSPWLAQGCLSPKLIYQELKQYEATYGANRSSYWIFFELLWRDFFRLMAKKYGNAIFLRGGIKGLPKARGHNNQALFETWATGKTGVPFVDANMRELNATGFMSNRGRQNVASFLVNDMGLNWQWGASYFESMLLDYDVTSNWGNWNYLAGIGADAREDRYFNIPSQVRKYDPQAKYIKYWLPELADFPADELINKTYSSENRQHQLA